MKGNFKNDCGQRNLVNNDKISGIHLFLVVPLAFFKKYALYNYVVKMKFRLK